MSDLIEELDKAEKLEAQLDKHLDEIYVNAHKAWDFIDKHEKFIEHANWDPKAMKEDLERIIELVEGLS